MSASHKRLAVFLDGTWNDPTDNTNVWRLRTMVARRDQHGIEQVCYYDTGVGTRFFERIHGGVGAYGLSKNIREAYSWLVENYDPGDEVFIFGFSRGAYTARSLAGLIARYGLLVPGAPVSVREVYALYCKSKKRRRGDEMGDEEGAASESGEWIKSHMVRIKIHFIGIWDTVGTLGIPFGNIPGISRKQLTFHNTRPSRAFHEAYQALALDEHRKAYDAPLWTNFIPTKPGSEAIVEGRKASVYYPKYEQRWFIGAHSNIGGGYQRDSLAQVPLAWIQRKAEAAGLAFRRSVVLSGEEHLEGKIVDSFRGFLKGLYRIVRLGRRHYRTVGRVKEKTTSEKGAVGFVETVNETVDPTVLERWKYYPCYRPKNLSEWARRTKKDLNQITAGEALRLTD